MFYPEQLWYSTRFPEQNVKAQTPGVGRRKDLIGSCYILRTALPKTERFSKKLPYRTVPYHQNILSYVPGLLYSVSYLILPNNLHRFLEGKLRLNPREKFAECRRRMAETQRRSWWEGLWSWPPT